MCQPSIEEREGGERSQTVKTGKEIERNISTDLEERMCQPCNDLREEKMRRERKQALLADHVSLIVILIEKFHTVKV